MRQPIGKRSETCSIVPRQQAPLNVSKTKERIVDYRKSRAEQALINIDGAVVQRVHPDWLHHYLVWQLIGLRQQGTTEGSAYGAVHHWGSKLPAIQDLYTSRCQRKAHKMG